MELKLAIYNFIQQPQHVLIVPSGIEATIALKISVDTNALIAPLLYKQIKETITIFCFFID